MKRQRPNGTVDWWWCSVRTKSTRCPATVIQTESNFRPGSFQHTLDSTPGVITHLKIVSQTKLDAAADPSSLRHRSSMTHSAPMQTQPYQLVLDPIFTICKGQQTDSARKPDRKIQRLLISRLTTTSFPTIFYARTSKWVAADIWYS